MHTPPPGAAGTARAPPTGCGVRNECVGVATKASASTALRAPTGEGRRMYVRMPSVGVTNLCKFEQPSLVLSGG